MKRKIALGLLLCTTLFGSVGVYANDFTRLDSSLFVVDESIKHETISRGEFIKNLFNIVDPGLVKYSVKLGSMKMDQGGYEEAKNESLPTW